MEYSRKNQREYLIVDSESGQNAISFTSILSLDFDTTGKVVSTDIEKGSFATYNKTFSPNVIKTTLAIEGENVELQSAISTLEKLEADTTKINFITPIAEYKNYTLENFGYTLKSGNGINVLYVDLQFSEVREVEPAYTDAKAISQSSSKKASNTSTTTKGKKQGTENEEKKKTMLKTWGNGYRSLTSS